MLIRARVVATSLVTNFVLQKLCLRKNNIAEDGAKAIGRLLGYTSIRDLDLFGNALGDPGARFLFPLSFRSCPSCSSPPHPA